ncbi:Tail fiber domain-containing protein [Pararobbsia alpina]|uniref:tail fiber domain-containing protein n=1 Tax=Pararobbsia alpina TaxID=621374 RepID=UPI0039A64365
MALWQWSTTPANNASAGAIDWAEGQPPSTVNDSARQMMADVATWYVSPEWLNYGLTPTYVSTTSFSLAGNQTAMYSVGRRVRCFVSAGTVYGTITASVYSSLTTVTVAIDSGNLDSGLSEVDVGILNPAASSLPTGLALAVASLTATGAISGATVTQTSDARLKKDWKPLADDFLERLAEVDPGTYRLIAGFERYAGVKAQDLQNALPEAVFSDEEGKLSVAYGNAALVAVIALTREVFRLRAMVESAK